MKIITNMQYTIQPPQHINTTITLPASKSVCNRALVIQALAGGSSLPANLSDCDDTRVIAAALRDMPETIDIGAAGTAMRFLTAYLSVTHGCHTITGTERMRHRPIGVLVDALRRLGADISYLGDEGYPPLAICGRAIEGGSLAVPGNVSSQYISALLMIGPMLRRGLELRLEGDIVSRPYIDLTLWTMTEFGAKAEWSDVDTITVAPVPYQPADYAVENDWSAASYWYEMLALCDDNEPRVVLPGLMDGSRQGDTICRYIGSLMGVKTTFGTGDDGTPQVVLSHQHPPSAPAGLRLRQFARPCPDLCRGLCHARHPLPLHRSRQSAHQGDRPHRGAEARAAQIGRGAHRPQRQRTDMEPRALRAHHGAHRHLPGPPHGHGLCPRSPGSGQHHHQRP